MKERHKIKLELIGLILAVLALIFCCVLLGIEIKTRALEREFEHIKTITIEKPVPTPNLINKP